MMIDNIEVGNRSVVCCREQTAQAVKNFYTHFGIKVMIGICGGSDEQDLGKTSGIISELLLGLKDHKIAILTGGTKGGIPELAVTIAKEFCVPTVGVFPQDGRKYALLDKLDLAIESLPPSIGKAGFGTETPTFVQLLHGLIVIGGEFGTLVEAATVLKNNKDRLRKNLPVIYVCPMKGTGGVADIIRNLPAIDKVIACLPEEDIYNGADAARFLRKKLFEV